MAIMFRIEKITPEKADEYLVRALPNRREKPAAVARFAHDMTVGRWHLAQPLMLDEQARLLDGRNRLLAVIRSGCTVPFCILTGFPAVIQIDVDSGTSRKAADNLKIAGNKNVILLAAATRLVMVSRNIGWAYPIAASQRHSSITSRSEELEEAITNESIRRCVEIASTAKLASRIVKSSSAIAWFLCANEALGYGDESKAFIDSIGRGAFAQGTPGDVLLRRLNSGNPQDRRIQGRERVGFFIKAWNSHITGGDRKILRSGLNESFPVLHGA